MKKNLSDYAILFLTSGTIILLDQLTKHLVRANVPIGTVFMPGHWLTLYVRIAHVKNTGAAFGMLQSLSTVFTVLAFVVGGVIIYYFSQVPREEWSVRLAMCMLLAGAMGNLIDRLTVGHVTDFISIWIFPVFNLADLSISTGVVILLLGMWIQEREKRSKQTAVASEAEEAPQGKSPHPLPEELQGE